MQVKSIAECSIGSILQYFQPSFSYNLPLRPLFCQFLSAHLRQVLLYYDYYKKPYKTRTYKEPDKGYGVITYPVYESRVHIGKFE